MRIGFFCIHNPFSRNSFSGTPFYALRALQARRDLDEVRVIGHRPQTPIRKLAAKFVNRQNHKLCDESLIRDGQGLDWIVSFVSTGYIEKISNTLKTPVVHVTDATPQFLRDFYNYNLAPSCDEDEARAISAAERVIYSSHFMRNRAILEFRPEFPDRMSMIPFGVNLDTCRGSVNRKPLGSPLKLLFIGKEWERKGGPLALEATKTLNARGVPTEITIIGSDPVEARNQKGVHVFPFLNKDNPRHARIFSSKLSEADVFILPTRADCTPMVIAEANSFSIPVIVTNTGGIGSLVKEGVSGHMLPMAADSGAWADAIQKATHNRFAFSRLRETSFHHFQTCLNWSAWADDLVKELALKPSLKMAG